MLHTLRVMELQYTYYLVHAWQPNGDLDLHCVRLFLAISILKVSPLMIMCQHSYVYITFQLKT